MFFRKFPRFSGYSSPSSSTIRSALRENAHPARSPKDVRKHKRGCDMRSNPTCLGSQGFSLWLALVGTMQGKMAAWGSQGLRLPRFNVEDGHTGFSSAAPATHQPLRWPYCVLKRCTCRTGILKRCTCRFNFSSQAAPAALQPLRPYGSAAPVTQTNGICRIIVQTKSPTKQTVQYPTKRSAPRCGVRSILAGRLTF